jgi:hypothetical protein
MHGSASHEKTACLVRATQTSGTDWFQILLLLVKITVVKQNQLHAQVGTFLNYQGVAVASQVLCTSTTLNKRTSKILKFHTGHSHV